MNKKTKADIILISALLLLAFVCFGYSQIMSKQGQVAVICINGVEVERHPLSVDGEFSLNQGSNILVIKNGYAYLKEANCPDKLCMIQGKIHLSGQCITCLPNRLTVTIEGSSDGGTDLVS